MVRLLICAGGTGGGVYPALAVLQALTGNVEVLWVGAQGGMESTLVQRAGIPFETIPAAGLHGVGLKRLPRNLALLLRGIIASRRIISSFKPDAILFTGGYIAFPMAVAARGIPTLLYVPDIEPGLALKIIARYASCIAVSAAESRDYFTKKEKVFVSGYPTRPELANWNQASARKQFNLLDNVPVLLIFGGSKGARSINYAVLDHLPDLLNIAQVIHISGELDWPVVDAKRKELTGEQSARYHAFPYLHEEMGAALASADLVISRSGASTLGEFPLHALAAILVPYPYAWRYQNVNAQHLASRGAAVVLEDSQLESQLVATIQRLLENPIQLKAMRTAMQSLSHPQAAALIGQRLFSLARERR
ncbi:MAG: undecaprenyldiphospho-muramoylpentapeptide beta-N-acetylglucosaminyltransferase [Chloroflexi bacterium GWB2_49_20]|nr:MAG: undecaprenyldiphospho-muramoylpentapeptide beta-N-acetylglucosaminyltransferase [Chloroflexi bacterium GWB2_49_20]OGN76147.1 MAG: undecaprenyldiphospho-muramoylpentapeptide beta-N-acetylglucosaminyltransferase [Chloroflexi bacterium GWC2_49_37]OGN83533.1 MAG: undecaprenyldiphospho-muramoylpentapeptide beta-N-acetylglucosaminyltransferase [Chloroflexi bacterium GWD2_49_16]